MRIIKFNASRHKDTLLEYLFAAETGEEKGE